MIVKDCNVCFGSAVIKGTRITVSTVLACIRDGESFDEICSTYNITLEDIADCLDYAIKSIDI